MIRILIVHQHHLMGDVLGTILKTKAGMEVIGCVMNSQSAIAKLEYNRCDIILIGGGLANREILQILDFLYDRSDETKVLLTDVVNSQAIILHYFEEGVNGYVHEEEPLDSLVEKLYALHRGEFPVPPAIAASLIARISELKRFATTEKVSEPASPLTSLTLREREVVRLIALGHTNQEIANLLVIEVGTVKNHVHSIFRKFGIQKREEAIFFAQQLDTQLGYLSLPDSLA